MEVEERIPQYHRNLATDRVGKLKPEDTRVCSGLVGRVWLDRLGNIVRRVPHAPPAMNRTVPPARSEFQGERIRECRDHRNQSDPMRLRAVLEHHLSLQRRHRAFSVGSQQFENIRDQLIPIAFNRGEVGHPNLGREDVGRSGAEREIGGAQRVDRSGRSRDGSD